jgi:hypothetical protein
VVGGRRSPKAGGLGLPRIAQSKALRLWIRRWIAQSKALRLWLRRGFAAIDSQSFALRNPKGGQSEGRRFKGRHPLSGLRRGFAADDSQSFALRNPKGGGNPKEGDSKGGTRFRRPPTTYDLPPTISHLPPPAIVQITTLMRSAFGPFSPSKALNRRVFAPIRLI